MKKYFALSLVILNLWASHTWADSASDLAKATKAKCWAKKTTAEQSECYDKLYSDQSIQTKTAKQWRKNKQKRQEMVQSAWSKKEQEKCQQDDDHVYFKNRCMLKTEKVQIEEDQRRYEAVVSDLKAKGCPERVIRKAKMTTVTLVMETLIQSTRQHCQNHTMSQRLKKMDASRDNGKDLEEGPERNDQVDSEADAGASK